jgi:hypothetical protein
MLELYPDDGPAANNLADLLLQRNTQLERAEQLCVTRSRSIRATGITIARLG